MIPAIKVSTLPVILKLPPVDTEYLASYLYESGVRNFHLCNTLPSRRGGISGKPLKKLSLKAVEEVRKKFPDVFIIGGGGITGVMDVKDYLLAGANSVSIASMLLNPLNWYKVTRIRDFLDSN